jgi:anti-sigma regulatory factor (Ser/Thr protein kinase)
MTRIRIHLSRLIMCVLCFSASNALAEDCHSADLKPLYARLVTGERLDNVVLALRAGKIDFSIASENKDIQASSINKRNYNNLRQVSIEIESEVRPNMREDGRGSFEMMRLYFDQKQKLGYKDCVIMIAG